MSFWVVSYDIPSNRRRRKVAKVLEGYGRRVQGSVFECDLDSKKIASLEKQLKRVIEGEEDDIRFYPLNQADIERVKLLGKAQLNKKEDYYIIDGDHPF